MPDRSHGSARAQGLLVNPRNQCANRDQSLSRGRRSAPVFAASGTTVRTHAAQADTATRWRRWIERAGARAATPRQPVWSSRQSWLDNLRDWAQSRALAAVCTAERVSITATTLLAIAAVMAEHADHATGRHVAITRATIAERIGCHPNTVSTAWAVLRASGWAVEAQRGHGSPGTPSVGRRPSVYHLVSRRPASVPVAPEPVELRGLEPLTSGGTVENCDLPPSGGVCFLSPVGSNSPSAQQHAENSSPTRKSRRWRAEPRPLVLQRLAARVLVRCPVLRGGHVGAICDVLGAAGIDPTVWTARDVQDALEADMRRTGGTWPDQVTNPGAFLASRLRRLGSFAGRQPPRSAATAPRPSAVSAPPASPQLAGAVTGTGRAEAFAALAAARRHAQHRRTAAAAAEAARLDALIATARAVTPRNQPITVWR